MCAGQHLYWLKEYFFFWKALVLLRMSHFMKCVRGMVLEWVC